MRSTFYIGAFAIISLAIVFLFIFVSWYSTFLTSDVGLLGAVKPSQVALGETELNETTVQVYARYEYDVAVLGIAVLKPKQKPRYLPLYGSTYRGLPPFVANLYVSKTTDGIWIEVLWDNGQPKLLEFLPLATDGTPVLQPPDTFYAEPIPSPFQEYRNSKKLDADAIKVLSVRHDEASEVEKR